jgi:NAD(P)-dependent dehydrogenase (short-subunit alcohol dehydrogenase family)
MAGRLAGRVALVTGASRGIGHAVASAIAAEGAHVVALARTVGGLESSTTPSARRAAARPWSPPTSDYPALDRLGAALFERFRKLDILIGNGGMLGKLTPLPMSIRLWDR